MEDLPMSDYAFILIWAAVAVGWIEGLKAVVA
jgi:hypothetical protein